MLDDISGVNFYPSITLLFFWVSCKKKMASIFIAAPKKDRDENGQPTKMFMGYRQPNNDFRYMSVSCQNGRLSFSKFGIELEPLAWSAVISGKNISSSDKLELLMTSRDGVREEEHRSGPLSVNNEKTEDGQTFNFKQDPLVVALLFLKLSGYHFPPNRNLHKLSDTI